MTHPTTPSKNFIHGTLACLAPDGTVQFIGRTDNQVKLRGHRIELDEIRIAIESHEWVKRAAAIVRNDSDTGFQHLIAFVELNPNEAALMDQGSHDGHHQSKESRLQVRVQLSNLGCRDTNELAGRTVLDLPGKTPSEEQRRQAFARKTYRFFEGGDVRKDDILQLLAEAVTPNGSHRLETVGLDDLGEILRHFGQFLSAERLLAKYSYASPGSLYATQMYLEIAGIGNVKPGHHYYHPVEHQLVLIKGITAADTCLKIHFMGKKRAIQPVYKNNIQEVLEIEAGHMVGLFEKILPKYGLGITQLDYTPAVAQHLQCADEDYYLGSFEVVPHSDAATEHPVEIYVQVHPNRIADLPAGQYLYRDGNLERVSNELVLKRHVIAINQQVYERSSLGITIVGDPRRGWKSYIDLGRKLQHLQLNGCGFGFMSAGYSSETGNDLPSAKRMQSILKACGRPTGSSYFFVGGLVSDTQIRSMGMNEDVVHMKGPAEMIRDDLINSLPHFMIPNKVLILDEMPLTANGKIDFRALHKMDVGIANQPFVAPRTDTEKRIAEIWKRELRRETVSVHDDFFATGGNSIIAVGLVNRINQDFQGSLPLQVLFHSPTLEQLALDVENQKKQRSSRLVPLRREGTGKPIYCWPGLGGYTLNLRLLANGITLDRPIYGVQAYGINDAETPYSTIGEMAAEDVKAIRQLQPQGPYTLWGYSFGARVAFEAAYQLEMAGEHLENLFLIAPGSPKVPVKDSHLPPDVPPYGNPAYVAILFSVFAGSITDPSLPECLDVTKDQESFMSFIAGRYRSLDADLVRRIIGVVHTTFRFRYTFQELRDRQIAAPVSVFRAQGDDDSFIENPAGYATQRPTIINLETDHYGMLKHPGVDQLVREIQNHLGSAE